MLPGAAVETTLPGSVVITGDPLIQPDPTKAFLPLLNLLKPAIESAQRVARRAPDPMATDAQRETFAAAKRADLLKSVSLIADTQVTVPVRILDVRSQNGRGQWPLVIISDLEPTTGITLNTDEKEKVARLKETLNRQLESMPYPTGKDVSRAETTSIGSSRSEIKGRWASEMQAVNDGAAARRPRHVVFINTNDPQVLTWRKGQYHTIRGMVRSIGIFPTERGRSEQLQWNAGNVGEHTGPIVELASGLYYTAEIVIDGGVNVLVPGKRAIALVPKVAPAAPLTEDEAKAEANAKEPTASATTEPAKSDQ